MTEIHKKLYFKLIVWVVLIITLAVSVISACEAVWAISEIYVSNDGIKDRVFYEMAGYDMSNISSYYTYMLFSNIHNTEPSLYSTRLAQDTVEKYSAANSNLGYVVYDMDGNIISGCSDFDDGTNIEIIAFRVYEAYKDYSDEDEYWSQSYGEDDNDSYYIQEYDVNYCDSIEEAIHEVVNDRGIELKYAHIICGYIRSDLKVTDKYSRLEAFSGKVHTYLSREIIVFAASAVVDVLCFIILMCGAGRRPGDTEQDVKKAVKVPFDILFVITAALIIAGVVVTSNAWYICMIIPMLCILVWASVILLCMLAVFAAAQIKAGILVKSCLSVKLGKLLWRAACGVFRFVKNVIRAVPVVWKTTAAALVITFIDFMLVMFSYDENEFILLWAVFHVILIASAVLISAALRYLKDSGRRIAAGDTDYRVDVKRLHGDFREHGEDLNNISGGIAIAVEEQMKSERLKTELITNVSHDIKTPLTSIINYVDLLKKENIESETAKEYIDVLDRQSARLKKLISDLIDASKASSGSIKTEMAPTSIGIIAEQAAGEYEERLKAAGLELVMNDNSGGAFVMVDGKLLWRVLDNLLGNACKYSMRGSRVYMNIEKSGSDLCLSIMNISAERLNITADELKERFVRGDSSRNTEGSGLGLSITESLMKIMNGDLNLYIEGDMFKAVLRFDLMQ
jgi:signal transduction histidine kinase